MLANDAVEAKKTGKLNHMPFSSKHSQPLTSKPSKKTFQSRRPRIECLAWSFPDPRSAVGPAGGSRTLGSFGVRKAQPVKRKEREKTLHAQWISRGFPNKNQG